SLAIPGKRGRTNYHPKRQKNVGCPRPYVPDRNSNPTNPLFALVAAVLTRSPTESPGSSPRVRKALTSNLVKHWAPSQSTSHHLSTHLRNRERQGTAILEEVGGMGLRLDTTNPNVARGVGQRNQDRLTTLLPPICTTPSCRLRVRP